MRSVHVGLLAIGVFCLLSLQSIAQQRPPGGTPVAGLTPAQQIAFNEGSRTFSKTYEIIDAVRR